MVSHSNSLTSIVGSSSPNSSFRFTRTFPKTSLPPQSVMTERIDLLDSRAAEESRELRRILDNSTICSKDFRLKLEEEAQHQHKVIDAERELRIKEFSDTHAALDVAHGRLAILEGTIGVHSTQLKELTGLADHVEILETRLETLERSFVSSDEERKATSELIESRLKDELSIAATAHEVQSQEMMRIMKLSMEQLESKLRDEFMGVAHDADSKVERVRHDLGDIRKSLSSQQSSLNESLDAIDLRLREGRAENAVKHQEDRQAFLNAVDLSNTQLRELIADMGGAWDAKHREQEHRLKLSTETMDARIPEEINRALRETDQKLEKAHCDLRNLVDAEQGSLRDDLNRMHREYESRQKNYPVLLQSGLDSLQSTLMQELQNAVNDLDSKREKQSCNFNSATGLLESKLREELHQFATANDAKHQSLPLKINSAVDSMRAALMDEIAQVSRGHDVKHEHVRSLAHTLSESLTAHRAEICHLSDDRDVRLNELQQEIQANKGAMDTKLADEVARMTRNSDAQHQQDNARWTAAAEALEVKARMEFAQLSKEIDSKLSKADAHNLEARVRDDASRQVVELNAQLQHLCDAFSQMDAFDVKVKEELTRLMRENGISGLEARMLERISDQDGRIEKHRIHHMGYLEGLATTLRKELSDMISMANSRYDDALKQSHVMAASLRNELVANCKEQDGKVSHLHVMVDALGSRLSEEITRASKDAEMHLKRGVQHLQSVIDTTDASWREELQRTSADHDVKRDRAHAALQGPVEAATRECVALREELVRLAGNNDRVHDETNVKFRAALESLDTKVTQALVRSGADGEKGLVENRTKLQNLEDMLSAMKSEHARLSEMSGTRFRDELARLAKDVDDKVGKTHHGTMSGIEALERKLVGDINQLRSEVSAESEDRFREHSELCAAVNSLQSHLSRTPRTVSPSRLSKNMCRPASFNQVDRSRTSSRLSNQTP